MKRVNICIQCIKRSFARIHLVDRCLILFMSVLLLQSAFGMFFLRGNDNETNHIDVIVRTSSASIFGYFLSANFIRNSSTLEQAKSSGLQRKKENKESSSQGEHGLHNRMGFGVEESGSNMTVGNAESRGEGEREELTANHLQIIAASTMGMFCLITLILLRDAAFWNPHIGASQSVVATITQFRDFISGCVGFLIGSPTRRSK